MKKTYLLMTALLSFMLTAFMPVHADETETFHVGQSTGFWTKWNNNSSNQWASQWQSTQTDPQITITHTNNNMRFWDGENIMFYSHVGSNNGQTYSFTVSTGYNIVGMSLDFVCSNAMGVSVALNDEEAVENYSNDEFEHVAISGINVTGIDMTVTSLGESTTFANTKNVTLYLAKQPGIEVAEAEFMEILHKYENYEEDDFQVGTAPGLYGEAERTAFFDAVAAGHNIDEIPVDQLTVEKYEELGKAIIDTYDALVASRNMTYTLPEGYKYFRVKAAMTYTTEEGDDAYKYLYAVRSGDKFYGYWATPDPNDALDNIQRLWLITPSMSNFDMVNLYCEGRFNNVATSAATTLSEASDNLMAFDPVYTDEDGVTILNIRVSSQEPNKYFYLQQGGHGNGTGKQNYVVGWKSTWTYFDGPKATEWVLEPVSDEEASAIIDAIPSAWSPAVMVSSDPENDSFEIESATFKNISITYDKPLSLSTASATLSKDGQDTDLTSAMSLSEDGKTINIAVSNLADGEYTLVLSGVCNSYEVACESDQVINFYVGADSDTSTSEVVYSTNETFATTANGTFPVGWLANDNGTIHQYGLTENGNVWNYNWGGNIGGGGCRAMTGYSGDLNGAAIYWRCLNGANSLGTLTYGEQVKDYILYDGTVDPEMPKGISLYLDARKYQITIRMCAWKNLRGNTDAVNEDNAPKYDFTLEDLDGNVYYTIKDVIAMPNVNGAQDIAVTGVTRSQTEFTIDNAGYYVLKFSTTQPNGEYLLGGVDLVTMPSKAAYWKQQLAIAVDAAEAILETAADDIFNGDTKTAFTAAINNAKTGHFTSPSEVNAMIDQLGDLGQKMDTRVKNIDTYNKAFAEATDEYAVLEGKYTEADITVNVKTLLDSYANTNPSELSDDELAEVTPKIVTAASQLKNVKEVVNILTWGAFKAYLTADKLGVDATNLAALTTDDREVIDEANTKTTIALYQYLAESNGEIADELKSQGLWDGSMIVVDGEYAATEADAVATEGIELTGFIQNPHFYTYSDNANANLENNTIVGWNCLQLENKDGDGNVTSRGSVHFNGEAASEAKPVTDVMINAYGYGAEYVFWQLIPNVPAGIYDIWIGSRTASNTYGDNIFEPFNAVNDETGIWDKYIFAQVADAGAQVDVLDDNDAAATLYREPFAVGSWGAHPTIIRNVTVKDGQTLTIGVCEHYTSGKATKGGEARNFWDTNTFADDARLYFVAPLAGFDYAAAAQELMPGGQTVSINSLATSSAATTAIYTISGQRVNFIQRGVNIVKRADGSLTKVLVK